MTLEVLLRDLLVNARAAYGEHVRDPSGQASVAQIFAALDGAMPTREGGGQRLPVCAHLDAATELAPFADTSLRALIEAFRALEPHLKWYLRTGDTTNANDAYWQGHANAMIVGPGGLVKHNSVWLGVSLLAPQVRYPDHTHPPEETYLVLSDGEFFQDGRGWFTPGIGGTFYNPPGILHAMRSGNAPLFAMWALRAEAPG